MSAEERNTSLDEFWSDTLYYRRLTHQAKLAMRGLAPVPVVPPFFRGVGAVMEGRAPAPAIPAHEVGTLRGKRPGRLKFRLARRSRPA